MTASIASRLAFVTIAKRPSCRGGTARMIVLIWVFQQCRRPAANWHDGQFAHDTHAPISLGLSGKSVIAAPHVG
jgi:hypothetical protein